MPQIKKIGSDIQKDLGLSSMTGQSGSVQCLGMEFPDDNARRDYFIEKLAEKLKDPEFRKIEGFPIGEDEDILALSDPPYYTACPNPWFDDFVKQYGKPYKPKDKYHREPFAADISEGKTNAIYKAHGYHTKTPHKAIMRFILHYTNPGDLVFDGFTGTGLTGVAAQLCSSRNQVEKLGYRVEPNGSILGSMGEEIGEIGVRRALLNDLSPAATFIAHNYNSPFEIEKFRSAALEILSEFEGNHGWMYSTHANNKQKNATINFMVWSEVFSCPECGGEVVFFNEALAKDKKVRNEFPCPHCAANLTKRKLLKISDTQFDEALQETYTSDKRVPVLVDFSENGISKSKSPHSNDVSLLERIRQIPFPIDFPTDRMMHAENDNLSWGDKWRSGTASFSHVHRAFMPRPRQALAVLWKAAQRAADCRTRHMLLFTFEQAIWGLSLMNRYGPSHFSQVNRYLSGVYYIASQISECSPYYVLSGKIKRLCSAFNSIPLQNGNTIISTADASRSGLPDKSIDYIFVDPPFGDNLAYAELNFIVESFHKVFTNQKPEAIISHAQKKSLKEYHKLMLSCFREYYRILKPGRWITIQFSNTRSSVWNAIQAALQEVGFVVANVAALDKQQKGFNAVVTPTSVKQDLVISAYKPNGGLEARFAKSAENEGGVWEFIRTHLGNIPVVRPRGGQLEPIAERDPRILYDRTVAFYVRHGIPVPLIFIGVPGRSFGQIPRTRRHVFPT